ncbi:MAG: heavy metal translocating P-type ATPase [Gemmatimonadaceae bacterium]
MTHNIRLDLPVLLPDVKDARDGCIVRLISLLEARDGVVRVHIVAPAEELAGHQPRTGVERLTGTVGQLCLHYDPERLTLASVADLAHVAGAEISQRFGHALLNFRLIGAEDDGPRLESGLRSLPGVTAVAVNIAAQSARIEYDRSAVALDAIADRLRSLGATVEPTEVSERVAAPADEVSHAGAGERESWFRRNRELVWSLSSGVLLLSGWLVERRSGVGAVALALYGGAYVFGARDNVGHFVGDLRKGRVRFNIDLLMVVAAAGAAVLGEWADGALLLFLFSLGHALEHYALGRARGAIKALAGLAPERATVLRDGREESVPVGQVRAGDRVVIRPAERIAVDGEVTEGRSSVNQAPITGESVPVEKVPGERVFAGSVNGNGALVVSVTAVVGDRTLDRVIKLVAEAQTQKAPTQQFTERFERAFVPLVLVADLLLMVVPPLLGVWSWADSFYRAMTLLVAASPCALALGTPAAVLSGIAQAARNGVLIKGGAYLEALGSVELLALDKTGTITRGEPDVTDLVPLFGATQEELLAIAAAVEARSQHPLARAVVREAGLRQLQIATAGDLEARNGFGVLARVGSAVVELGRLRMFEEITAASGVVPDEVRWEVARLEASGRTTVVVRTTDAAGTDGALIRWLGVIGIADEPRANVRATLDRLRALGIRRIVMLTGDNRGVGDAVGRSVGVDEVRAGLLPEDKVTAIKELGAGGQIAMVGDGVNDAPALAHASVGVAMGGAGTAAALETADVALMGDDLARLPFAIGLSRQARSVIKQNLVVSLGVIAVLIVASVLGWVRIGLAVVLHEGSTLVVVANALRLLSYREAQDV